MKRRFECLDVFRGLAAIIVAIFHYGLNAGTLNKFPLFTNGHRLVDFFFVLSGFIIYYNYKNVNTVAQRNDFLVKRVFRLYPLHLFMLVLFLLFEITKAGLFHMGLFKHPAFSTNNLAGFLQQLFMLQGIAKTSADFTWNYPSWSISTEMFAYLVFAFAIIPINRISVKFRTVTFLVISLIAFLAKFNDAGYANFIAQCIYGFFLGCVIERIYQSVSKWKISNNVYTLLEIITAVITLWGICSLKSSFALLLSPLYALMILVYASEKGQVSKLITNKATVWIGSLSFSIYMTHALIAMVVQTLLLSILKVNTTVYNLSTIVFVGVVIIFSNYTYKYIEKKGRNVIASFLYKTLKFKLPADKKVALAKEN